MTEERNVSQWKNEVRRIRRRPVRGISGGNRESSSLRAAASFSALGDVKEPTASAMTVMNAIRFIKGMDEAWVAVIPGTSRFLGLLRRLRAIGEVGMETTGRPDIVDGG